MAWAIVENGAIVRTLQSGRALTIGAVQHPESIFRLWSKDELKRIGIYEIVERGVKKNDKFYFNAEETAYNVEEDAVVRQIVATPKDLASLKTGMISAVKQAAAGRLSQYDWMVIRAIEIPDKAVPNNIKLFRTAVRAASNQMEEAINSATTVEELEAIQFEWPETP